MTSLQTKNHPRIFPTTLLLGVETSVWSLEVVNLGYNPWNGQEVDLPTQKDWWKEPFPLFRLGRWWLLMDFASLKTCNCNIQRPVEVSTTFYGARMILIHGMEWRREYFEHLKNGAKWRIWGYPKRFKTFFFRFFVVLRIGHNIKNALHNMW